MALELIIGPAHAGKIAELYVRYLAELGAGRRASLVVPSSDVKRQTQHELLERAQEIGVEGRSTMSKDELIDLMRDAVAAEMLLPEPIPEDWRAALDRKSVV